MVLGRVEKFTKESGEKINKVNDVGEEE